MAYSDYKTLEKVEKEFGFEQKKTKLFTDLRTIKPTNNLVFELEDGKDLAYFSEKARSEFIIAPILREIRRINKTKITVFSGVSLNVPKTKLKGVCDFIISFYPQSVELKSPLICVVEAKQRTLEEGYGQCAAEMYATKLFNEAKNIFLPFAYGCVTNGSEWSFLKLENNILWIDTDRYYLQNVGDVIGVFQAIINEFE